MGALLKMSPPKKRKNKTKQKTNNNTNKTKQKKEQNTGTLNIHFICQKKNLLGQALLLTHQTMRKEKKKKKKKLQTSTLRCS